MATPALSLRHVSAFARCPREPHQTVAEITSSKYLYEKVGSLCLKPLCVLPEYGLPWPTAAAGKALGRDVADSFAGSGGGARYGSGKKNALIPQSAVAACRILLLPHRDSRLRSRRLKKSSYRSTSPGFVGYESLPLEGLRTVAEWRSEHVICWCCFWAAPSAISIVDGENRFWQK